MPAEMHHATTSGGSLNGTTIGHLGEKSACDSGVVFGADCELNR